MRVTSKILITDPLHPVFWDLLKDDFHIDYFPEIHYSEVLNRISEYEILVLRTGFYADEQLFERATRLKIIARAGAGMDNIDLVSAQKHQVVCLNAPEGNRDAVAEQTIGMLLSLLHNVVKGDREVRNFLWQREENRGTELKYKTVGIIGFGNTGSEVGKRLLGFGCRILAYDKYLLNYGYDGIDACNLEMLQKESDIVCLHIPLTDETQHWVNDDFLNAFRKPIYILNMSRGQIVETSSLIRALNHGKILGIGTDVLENEKLNTLSSEQRNDFKDLIERDNVILTPHIGGWTHESYRKISEILAKKIQNSWRELTEKSNNFDEQVQTHG